MLFSNKKKTVFRILSGDFSWCGCVYQRTTLKSTSAFIHKQKDHSVLKLSLVLHGCLHQLVKLRKPMWDYKNIYKGIRTSFSFLFSFFLLVGRLIFFFTFASAEERGISDFCAVTWLDGDRHLKRWHSAGPMTTATHDEEETCMQRLWSFDPPLSANTRWSTEPPWIL